MAAEPATHPAPHPAGPAAPSIPISVAGTDSCAVAVPAPVNEPVRSYQPGSAERISLQHRLSELSGQPLEVLMTIDGAPRRGGGTPIELVMPHRHRHVLGTTHNPTTDDAAAAVMAAKRAGPGWRALPYAQRAAIFLRAADLLSGPWRDTLNAATMLGQSKTCYQAEIDSACELIDFWRFNVYFGQKLLADQPNSAPGVWNQFDHRPLEGFVLAVTPFNFTSIAGNLPTAPALMGSCVVWKPAVPQLLAAHYTMRLLEAAGLPPGVINMLTGHGQVVSEVALADPDFAGLHFTGSTATFRHLWRSIAQNLDRYRNFPRIVGETGGKDFIIAHPSADVDALNTALVRGAFEYQGQKCSAASRAYLPRSLWHGGLRDRLVADTGSLRYGDVTDFANFGGAIIDKRSYDRLLIVLDRIRNDDACRMIVGGTGDDSEGYFVRPTVVECTDPKHEVFTTEFFGPILSVYVYDDADFESTVELAASTSPYGLTGSLFATDRRAIAWASEQLRYAAGNFYINDKPTGAVVGQQPFGGARASGTNDKAGSWHNLVRWISPRVVKETFVPPTDYRYPHML